MLSNWPKNSIRLKLTVRFVVIILIANTALAVFTSLYMNHLFLDEVQTRVRLNLNAAKDVYKAELDLITQTLQAASVRRQFVKPIGVDVKGEFGDLLKVIRRQLNLDFLTLVDIDGNVIFRTHNPTLFGDSLKDIVLLNQALKEHIAKSGTMLLSLSQLKKDCEDHCHSTEIAFSDGEQLPSVMVMASAVPMFNAYDNKKPMAVLFGVRILNNRYEIVDRIKETVFQNQIYGGRDIGTATIFQYDVRIATNVRDEFSGRAVGTKLNAKVRDHVFKEGKIWADRSFIINDWYISAYEPIYDPNQKIIGALYVGLLERPFVKIQGLITFFLILMMVLTATGSTVLLFYITRKVLKPIDAMTHVCGELMQGNLSARIKQEWTGEMGVLGKAINHMADAVEAREQNIIETAEKSIIQSEKLASIGRLAAGVAHEVNNPLTGVLTFAHLLRRNEKLESAAKKDVDVIIRETTRVRDIVRGLLEFSRQSPVQREWLDVNQILKQVLLLVRGQKEFSRITFVEKFDPKLASIFGDRNQLQQVFLNLIMNGLESIADSGTLTLETSQKGQSVNIDITDTGCGIKAEHLDKIFEPFFTTKPVGKGTGLGLSVSYGIVKQHRGSITVKSPIEISEVRKACEIGSNEGSGTTFSVTLPIK